MAIAILRHYLAHLSSNFVSDTLTRLVQRGLHAISIFLLFIVLGACIIIHNIVLRIIHNIRHTRVHYRVPQSVNQLCKYIVKCIYVSCGFPCHGLKCFMLHKVFQFSCLSSTVIIFHITRLYLHLSS